MQEFLEGQLTGALFLLGGFFNTMSYATGPGGPISGLTSTKVIYQYVINATLLNSEISSYEIAGISCGIMATLIIALWDDIVARCKSSETDDEYKSINAVE